MRHLLDPLIQPERRSKRAQITLAFAIPAIVTWLAIGLVVRHDYLYCGVPALCVGVANALAAHRRGHAT